MLIKGPGDVTVVHLVGYPFGLDQFKRFFASYLNFESGHPHKLIILFNGLEDEMKTSIFHNHLKSLNINYESYSKNPGFDIDSYFWVLRHIKTEFVLFFNSYSEIADKNWLSFYMRCIKERSVGAVSATGSFQSIFSQLNKENQISWDRDKDFCSNFRKYKLLIKNNSLYRLYFSKFPNPHIRTNGFIIKASLMATLKIGKIQKKMDAYRFESGRNSFTRQLIIKGYQVRILGKNGKCYSIEDWPKSEIFCSGQQSNLLIKDNQTINYELASPEEKHIVSLKTWGK